MKLPKGAAGLSRKPLRRRTAEGQRHRRRGAGAALLAALGACAAGALLSTCGAFVPGARVAVGERHGSGPRRPPGPRTRGAAASAAAPLPEDEKEEFRYLTLTLLQRVQSKEGDVAEVAGEAGDFNLEKFRTLLSRLDLESSEEASARLFAMVDSDGSGSVRKSELRVRLRECEAIADMYSESLQNVGFTVLSAFAAAALVAVLKGGSAGLDFLTAYVVEDSLSVDNLFVFLLLFNYFKVPPSLQSLCLNLGVYGAVILRAIFIFIGLSAVKAFQPLLLFFSAFLIYASYTGLVGGDDEDEEDKEKPPEFVTKVLNMLPTTDKFDGDKLWVEGSNGQLLATPLALCIISVELCDVLFAVDSIPAVFAVTDDPVVVFGSNIAAILGLRSLYQVLSVAAQDLVYLEKSVAVILGFVGVKLGLEVVGIEFSSLLSLGVILSVLGVGIGASVYEQRRTEST